MATTDSNFIGPVGATPATNPNIAGPVSNTTIKPPVTPTGGNAVVVPNNSAVAYSFLDGSGYNSQGQQVKAPTVVTAKSATDDLAKKQADLTTATTAMGNQAQNIAANRSVASTQDNYNATVDANTTALSDATAAINAPTPTPLQNAIKQLQASGINDPAVIAQKINTTYFPGVNTDSTPVTASDVTGAINANNPALSTNDQLQAVQDKQDAAYQNFANQIQQIQNGTFPLTIDQQAQVNALQAQFDQLKQQQALANQNYTGGVTNAGIASGRNRYAPEIELGNIQATVSAGIAKIAAIDVQASSAISQLRQGFMSDNYELINSAYTAANQAFSQKSDTIQKMSDNVRQQTQDALAKHQQDIENQRAEDDRTTAAIKFAADNEITKPYYLIGKTAIDTKTGLPVSYAEYLRATGQSQDTPEDQADWSQIQGSFTTPEARSLAQQQLQFIQSQAQNESQFDRTLAQNEAHFNAEHPSTGDSVIPVVTGDPDIDAALFKQNTLQDASDTQTINSYYNKVVELAKKVGKTPETMTTADVKKLSETDVTALGEAVARIIKPDVSKQGGEAGNFFKDQGFLPALGQSVGQSNPLSSTYGKGYSNTKVVDAFNTATSYYKAANKATDTTSSTQAIPKGTDGSAYGFPGYISDGTQWVPK